MRPLSRRERGIVAIGLLVTLVAIMYTLAVAPLMRGFSARAAQRQTLTLQIQRNSATIASIERLRRQVERGESQLAGFAILAPSRTAGRAQLAQRVQAAIESAGGEVRDSDPAQAPAGWVGARVTARMTLAQAASALARLQNDRPPLTIEGVTIGAEATDISDKTGAMEISVETAVPIFSATPR